MGYSCFHVRYIVVGAEALLWLWQLHIYKTDDDIVAPLFELCICLALWQDVMYTTTWVNYLNAARLWLIVQSRRLSACLPYIVWSAIYTWWSTRQRYHQYMSCDMILLLLGCDGLSPAHLTCQTQMTSQSPFGAGARRENFEDDIKTTKMLRGHSSDNFMEVPIPFIS